MTQDIIAWFFFLLFAQRSEYHDRIRGENGSGNFKED